MKRQWGFDHIITKKSMKRASADVGFIFIAYNLRRIINIVGIDQLIKADTPFYSIWSTNAYKNLHKALFYYLTSSKPTLYPKLKISNTTSFFAIFTKNMWRTVGF
jgi:hypothetical protein